ncbi:MAG: serine hydrolase [Spirosomaceae bacterium]|nr:serine hydrolase [Spirosomataceae bacterium]
MKLQKALFVGLWVGLGLHLQAQVATLRQQIQGIVAATDGTLGIAILDLDSKDSLTFHNTQHFPMQSVFKFHLGLAVLHGVDQGRWKLDQEILITKKDLLPNTWSPLRDKYPEGNVKLPLRDILKFTVADSDNNGCDILFRLVGGPQQVEKYLRSIGIKEVAIATDEAEMHRDDKAQYRNWSTPWAAVQLMQKFYQKKFHI